MKVFVEFDGEGILSRMVKTSDPSMEFEGEMEEVTDLELINALQVNHFKKVDGFILPMSEEEINTRHNESAIYRFPLDKQEKTIV